MILWAILIPESKGITIGSAVFTQVTALGVIYFTILYNGHPFSQNCPFPWGDLDPHLTQDSLGPSEPTTQTEFQSVQPFLHRWPQNVPVLYNGMPPSPSKLPLPTGDLDPHLIHGSLGPPESSTQMASRSVQSFLQGSLVWKTDRPTNHVTRLETDRIYVRIKGGCGLTTLTKKN